MFPELQSRVPQYSSIELKAAESLLSTLSPTFLSRPTYGGNVFQNVTFEESFCGNRIDRSLFNSCTFRNVNFDGVDGKVSRIINSELINCEIKDSCFDCTDFSNTAFSSGSFSTKISSSGFSYANFSNADLKHIESKGVCFENSFFYKTSIRNSVFKYCNFEGSQFKDNNIIDVDLSLATVSFCSFKDVIFENVTFQYFDILKTFGGLSCLKKSHKNVNFKFSDSDVDVPFEEFYEQITTLESYFYDRKEFFILANIKIDCARNAEALEYIKLGILDSLQKKDFKLIYNYCKLASSNILFSHAQLKKLYNFLSSIEFSAKLNDYEHQIYLREMEKIRHVLVDSPFELPQMHVSIDTTIQHDDSNATIKIINALNECTHGFNNCLPTSISIRRNSPLFFDLLISSDIASLYAIYAQILATITVTAASAKQFYTVLAVREKWKSEKLDNKLKEIKLNKIENCNNDKKNSGQKKGDNPKLPVDVSGVGPKVANCITTIRMEIRQDSTQNISIRECVVTDVNNSKIDIKFN